MSDATNFDESVRRALEAAVDATRSSLTPTSAPTSPLSPSSLAGSPAFFEALCGACRHATPLEMIRAAEGEQGEGEPPDADERRSQRLLLAALAAARALRGAAPQGYEARVLREAAKRFSSALSDELAEALASSLLVADKEEGKGERGGYGGGDQTGREFSPPSRPPLQLQAFFFGLEEHPEDDDGDDDAPSSGKKKEQKQKKKPTLSSTRAFPVAVSSSPDLLSGGTGRALWPASRALSALLLSGGSELARGRRVTELGCGAGMVGAALSVGAAWWRRQGPRRRRRGSEEDGRRGGGDGGGCGGGGGGDGDEEGGSASSSSFSPLSLRLTDGDADSVANARRTLEANGVREGPEERLSVGVLDWLEEERRAEAEEAKGGGKRGAGDGAPGKRGGAEGETLSNLVVGSDIMYDPESALALSRVLASLLSPPRPAAAKDSEGPSSSSALLAGVVRSEETAAAFERAFAGAGLSFERSSDGGGGGPPPMPGAAEEWRDGVRSAYSPSLLLPRVRAWHSGDEGVKVRWWRLRREEKNER